MSKRVGVVIPTYNASLFIGDALRSVSCQTVPPDQVIVVDDCSTDDTVDVARAHGATVITLEENAGPATARNVGVRSLEDCDFVAFLDADDTWAPEHIAFLLQGFGPPEVALVHSKTGLLGAIQVNKNTLFSKEAPRDALVEMLYANAVSQSSVMVRIDDFWSVGGYLDGLRFSEDYDLWLRLAVVAQFVRIPHVTSFRRLHEAQASRNLGKLLRGASTARTRAMDFAKSRGRPVSTTDAEQSTREMFEDALRLAAYSGDRSIVSQLLSVTPPSSREHARLQDWWRRRRFIWPLFKARAALRHFVRALK